MDGFTSIYEKDSSKVRVIEGTGAHMHWIEGNWAIIEIMCHELTHSIILGHDKDFFKLFYKFLSQMAEAIFSGDFYYWYTRQHESRGTR